MADAKAVFDQAMSNGAEGDQFVQLEKRICSSTLESANIKQPAWDKFQSLAKLYTQGQYQKAFNKGSQFF